METKSADRPQFVVRDFPVALRKKIKVAAAKRDMTMREAVIQGMERWLKNGKRESRVKRASET